MKHKIIDAKNWTQSTFVVQHVLGEGQHRGEHAADAQPQHTGTDEEERGAGVEDQQKALDQDDPHLTESR